jgi:hypothetical protein
MILLCLDFRVFSFGVAPKRTGPGCLSNVPAGCDTISDKQSCLTSMDGQDFTSSALSFMTLTSEGGAEIPEEWEIRWLVVFK